MMKNIEIFDIYVGQADPPHSSWKFIPDTPEERQRAAEGDYTAGSTMSFAYEPEKGKPQPVRRGSLFLDFDSKRDPALAVAIARELIGKLADKYQVDPECWRYWMSGSKGCHIEIPAAIYGGEAGHPELPLIQKDMLSLLRINDHSNPKVCEVLDFQLYCQGKGCLLRWPNITRPNGRYKVPVSAEEFFNLLYPDLERLTMKPRIDFDPETKEPIQSSSLTRIYDIAAGWRRFSNSHNPISGIEAILNCSFIAHCFNDQVDLPEPHWWAMISVLATFGEAGRELIHEFSLDYPGYTFEETERKIRAQQPKFGHKAVSCGYICKSAPKTDPYRHLS